MAASPTTAGTNAAALGLLIYDGDCGFCTTAARKFADFAGESATIMPWQALDPADFGLTEADCTTSAYWVQDGQHYGGADAVVCALQVCKSPWPRVGRVLGTRPFIWLARLVYPVVARFRHLLPGATDACRIS